MPFSRIVDSRQLAALAAVLDDICRQAGLEPGSPECDDAARFIMRLYWAGHRTAEDLKAAMLDSVANEGFADVTTRKAFDQSESPAPVDRNASPA
jgi:hypothetical protein